MVARSVLWRGRVVRPPPVNRPKESPSLWEICSTESTFALAAASSMASGMPSSLWHSLATADALCSVTSKIGATALPRSMKSLTAS
jgi:hypothetical protein